ncbi:MAG: chemotaxis protein CheW, partial [Candidatus Neomarinimicrobiota bacterium]
LQLVGFRLGQELFGVDILKVQDINRLMKVTKIPHAPEFVEGVINLRGAILPVIDLRRRFGLEAGRQTKSTRIIVVRVNEQVVGFVVDAVEEVLRIPTDTVEPPPPIVAGIDSGYITGVAKLNKAKDDSKSDLLILLDLDQVLNRDEQDQMKSSLEEHQN